MPRVVPCRYQDVREKEKKIEKVASAWDAERMMLGQNLEKREAEVQSIEGGAPADGVDIKLLRGA
eukprot:6039912-Alexandrium_andersonii.AAC.1